MSWAASVARGGITMTRVKDSPHISEPARQSRGFFGQSKESPSDTPMGGPERSIAGIVR